MRVDPTYKKADVRITEVPDSYVGQRFSLIRALSYPAVLLVLVGCIFFGVSTVRTWVTSRFPVLHPTPTASVPPTPQIDCPNQPLPPVAGLPTLSFCSPEYMGNVAGPVGARIVLVGEDFFSLPTRWLLLKQSTSTLDTLAHCPSGVRKDSLVLPPPSIKKQIQSQVFWFSWIWQAPFPVEPGDYCIIAQVGNQLATSSFSFSLLSSQSPCITISGTAAQPGKTGKKSDCTQLHPVPLKRDASINIQGTNWLLGWNPQGTLPLNMQVEVTANCIPHVHCGKSQLFDVTVPSDKLDHSGTFSLLEHLPGNTTGTYAVSAWNKTQTRGEPGGSQNTAADHALTFGGETSDLILQIS